MLDRAIALASDLFKGKFDKGGHPYILHCLYVMNQMPEDDEDLRAIAVLHDVVEDTDWSVEDIRVCFNDRVANGVRQLTHIKGESYDEYLRRVGESHDASMVKLADLKHNSDITRMKGLRQKDFDRLEKYHRAYKYIEKQLTKFEC